MRKTAKSIALILAVVLIIAMFPITASAASNTPGKVKITSFKVSALNAKTNTTTVTIKWNKVSKATAYWVYQRTGDAKWKLVKKVNKKYTGIKIYKVFAGKNAFKVRAVRTANGKTYKGTFSATKTKMVWGKFTYEKCLKTNKQKTAYSQTYENGEVLKVTIKGNKIVVTDTLPAGSARPSDADIDAFIKSWEPDIRSDCRNARLFYGVKGVTGIVKVYLGDEPLMSSGTIKE